MSRTRLSLSFHLKLYKPYNRKRDWDFSSLYLTYHGRVSINLLVRSHGIVKLGQSRLRLTPISKNNLKKSLRTKN